MNKLDKTLILLVVFMIIFAFAGYALHWGFFLPSIGCALMGRALLEELK